MLGVHLNGHGAFPNTNEITENKRIERNSVSKKANCFSVYINSFLKKLTLQYFSVVRAVPPEEIGRGIFATMSSLSVSLVLS